MSDRNNGHAVTAMAFDPLDERAAVGCLMLYGDEAVAAIEGELSERHFSDHLSKWAFRAFEDLRATALHPDPPTVSAWLADRKQLDGVGGAAAVSHLCDDCGFPSTIGQFVGRIRRAAALRAGRDLSQYLASVTQSPLADVEEIGTETRRRLDEIEALQTGRRRSTLPEMVDACELAQAPPPRPPEVIEQVLHEACKGVVGGGSKSYKTWILIDMAVSVASGLPWMGFATHRGRVCYINLEIHTAFFHERVQLVSASKRAKLKAGELTIWTLRGHAADISQLIPEIIRQCKEGGFSLVIVDPIYKVMGGRDENAAGDIGGLLNEIERLAVETGAAVVFGAHFSKGNQAAKESMDRIGGSGVYGRDPDTILTLTKHEEDDAFTVDAILRNHPPIEPFVVRWNFPVMERAGDLDPAKLKQVGGRQKLHDADELLGVLRESEMTYGAWLAAAKEHTGMGASTFKKLRTELVKVEQVLFSKMDQTYQKAKKAKKAK